MEKITSKGRNTEKKRSTKKSGSAASVGATDTVEVLYQRLGDRWFAFSVVGDEVFFSEVPEDAIEAVDAKMNSAMGKAREPKAA